MFALSLVIITSLTPPFAATANDGDRKWFNSGDGTIRAQISAIFDRIKNVDIIISNATPDQMEQIDYLVGCGMGPLMNKTVRIYEEVGFDEGNCVVPPKITPSVAFDPDVDIDEYDLLTEQIFITWDRSYETFVKMWVQNQYDGYVVFGNSSLFDTLLRCLVGPKGTYLIVFADEENFVREEVAHSLEKIWQRDGAFQVFVLVGDLIFTFNPFLGNNDHSLYGRLIKLTSTQEIPSVPQNNFNGFPLRIEMFHSTYSEAVTTSNGSVVDFTGVDAMVRQVFVETLNFTPIRIPPDRDLFGDRLPNGSFNGALGRLSRHKSDIAFVGFFIKDYFSTGTEFTTGMYSDELCCLVKKASRVPEYLLPVTIFPPDVWLLLFFMGIVFTVAWIVIRTGIRMKVNYRTVWYQKRRLAHLFNLTNRIRDGSLFREWTQILIDTYILLLSAPFQRFTRSGIERLLLFSLMMVSLIFTTMFQSELASVFVHPVYYRDIDSLQQLDQSGFKIPVKYKGYLDDVFPANYSPTMESLRGKITYQPTSEAMLTVVARLGTIATVTRRTTLALDNAIYLSTKQLHMIPECPRSYNLAYVVSRHSILLEQINIVLLRMLNGGLVSHWISEMNYNVTIRDWERVRELGEPNFKTLTIVDMQFPFYLLAIGLALSTGVFVVEQLWPLFASSVEQCYLPRHAD
ncbi:uncharacterized protein LOC129761552 [Toxorhynchites rutilus septentrionalis]|uniref:uncharacterized protein LOC129761552 n=1 Tax=Toxorhynchites rutilus septentrionalis TaxID=329112 RepID=UPI00247ADFA9|nr:uncharacterized protein LOC129761552 [Toxorhynchites rutilus septentrionalis]